MNRKTMKKDKIYRALMTGVGAAALCAGSALAQTDTIIVTATKRPQTLQEVPVAVSVVDADAIEKAQILDLIDLQTSVPSLRVTQLQNSSQTNFVIRGFGNGANNPGIESSVGVFIDGVFRSRSASAILDLPTLERVEVLRGPQSTLFGKNVSAGAISITTKKPEFDIGGSVEASYGNYNQVLFKGTLTGPLSETLAFRVSGSLNERDGYYTNIVDGSDVNERSRWSARAQLLWEPSDVMAWRLIGEYNKIDEVCCGAVQILNGPATLAIGAPPPFGLGRLIGDDSDPFAREIAYNENPTNELTGKGLSLHGDWDLGGATVTSITSYREQDDNTQTDADFSSADVLVNPQTRNYQTFTQELRIASSGDNFVDYLIGGFYFDESVEFMRDVTFGSEGRLFADFLAAGAGAPGAFGGIEAALMIPPGTFFADGTGVFGDYTMDNRSYSIFGQLDFNLTERLTLTGGVAYINDRKESVGVSTLTESFSLVDLNALGFPGAVFALSGADITMVPPAAVPGILATPVPVAALAPGFVIDPATGETLTDPQTVGSLATAISGT
ncbi:MAG: TonB-dependent receptor, partial [Marinicaulis sp.]|nr:TonB-dependent receptor [Marinicaulis sp.]